MRSEFNIARRRELDHLKAVNTDLLIALEKLAYTNLQDLSALECERCEDTALIARTAIAKATK